THLCETHSYSRKGGDDSRDCAYRSSQDAEKTGQTTYCATSDNQSQERDELARLARIHCELVTNRKPEARVAASTFAPAEGVDCCRARGGRLGQVNFSLD